MPFKSLDKAKSLITPRTQVMGLRECDPWSHGNLLKLNEATGKIFEANISQRCSKTMPKGPPLKRWDMRMKVDLKKSKDNSRSPSSLKSIKESRQGEGKIEG